MCSWICFIHMESCILHNFSLNHTCPSGISGALAVAVRKHPVPYTIHVMFLMWQGMLRTRTENKPSDLLQKEHLSKETTSTLFAEEERLSFDVCRWASKCSNAIRLEADCTWEPRKISFYNPVKEDIWCGSGTHNTAKHYKRAKMVFQSRQLQASGTSAYGRWNGMKVHPPVRSPQVCTSRKAAEA